MEERRKQRELEEARKAGLAAPALDAHDGQVLNPHLPAFIVQAPWYMDTSEGAPTLKHQRRDDTDDSLQDEAGFKGYTKQISERTHTMTKFRKGACDNCGALGHTKKECLERPRKISMKHALGSGGRSFTATDTVLVEERKGFDAKRDRWNDYDPEHFASVIDQYKLKEEIQEELVRQKKEQDALSKNGSHGNGLDRHGDHASFTEENDDAGSGFQIEDLLDSDEDDVNPEELLQEDVPGQKLDLKSRMTVRNLRLREDTAKYLRDLDPNSLHVYDPKSRNLRLVQQDTVDTTTVSKVSDEEVSPTAMEEREFVRSALTDLEATESEAFCWHARQRAPKLSTKLNLDANVVSVAPPISKDLLDAYGDQHQLEFPPDFL